MSIPDSLSAIQSVQQVISEGPPHDDLPPAPIEDPEVLRQHALDDLFTAAAVLKKLVAGEKIRCLDRGSINIEIQPTWVLIPTRVVRFFSGQSTDRTLACVQSIYNEFWNQMNICLSRYDECEQRALTQTDSKSIKRLSDERFREYQLVKRLEREARETVIGTRSLTSTYRTDTKFSSSIEVLIKNVSAKVIEYDRLIAGTFERSLRQYAITNINGTSSSSSSSSSNAGGGQWVKHHSPALSFLPRDFGISCSPLDMSSVPGSIPRSSNGNGSNYLSDQVSQRGPQGPQGPQEF